MAKVPPPPRLTNEPKANLSALNRYVNTFYKVTVLDREFMAASEHPFGSFTLSDSETSKAVAFPEPQPGTSYVITATPVAEVGAPAAGARDVKTIVKTTTGFTVGVDAAPGAAASVTYDWILRS